MEDITEITGSVTNNSANMSSKTSGGHFVISKCRRNEPTTATNNNQETSEESEFEERLLSVSYRSGTLGAAGYTLQTGELQLLEEIVDRPPEFLIFQSLYNQIEPTMLILDGKAPAIFVSAIKKLVFNETNEEAHCKLIFISAKEYNFEACKRRVYALSLPHEPARCDAGARRVFLRTALDFAQTQSVHALGALLRYVDAHGPQLARDLHAPPSFLVLKRISLSDIVAIDEDTYRGLQIFNSIAHPSGFKKGAQGSSKEGLSLFQLFSKCSSKVGHRRMRVFLRHPTSDLAVLKKRQDVIAYFMDPQHEPLMRNICASLRFIKNVNGILAKIKALSAKAYQWKSLYNALYNAVLICEMCESAGPACEYLEELASSDTHKLYEMAVYMNRIIDFDLSKSEGKFTVKAGVDPDLDLKKQTMASLQGLMSETARVELARLPDSVDECSMLYMPHLGYLLAVRAPQQLPEMRFMFQNDDYIHYKSKGCEELDAVVGDTYPEIVAHEARVMMRLAAELLDNLHSLSGLVDVCAELDCLITISKVCKELNFVRPTLTTDKVIDIKQGWHPLCIAAGDNFVPNDLESSEGAGYVKILTGPNSSGKSVFMKQAGLAVFLAHTGSCVPARAARVGLVRGLHSRMRSAESVAAHMSAFLIDLRQMSLAMAEARSNSLLLVDEFGKGTAGADGLALLAACANTLLFREQHCLHLLLATHFLNIREFIVDSPTVRFLAEPKQASLNLAEELFQRFEHMMHEGLPVFLFRAVEGAADHSFAQHVAEGSGVSAEVIARSRTVLAALTTSALPPALPKVTAKLRLATDRIKAQLVAEDL